MCTHFTRHDTINNSIQLTALPEFRSNFVVNLFRIFTAIFNLRTQSSPYQVQFNAHLDTSGNANDDDGDADVISIEC